MKTQNSCAKKGMKRQLAAAKKIPLKSGYAFQGANDKHKCSLWPIINLPKRLFL